MLEAGNYIVRGPLGLVLPGVINIIISRLRYRSDLPFSPTRKNLAGDFSDAFCILIDP